MMDAQHIVTRRVEPPVGSPQHLPSPDAHARVLIRVYGHHRAFRIAQRNSRLTAPEAYWADVRDTVLRLEPRH